MPASFGSGDKERGRERDIGEKAGSYCSRIVAFRAAKGFLVMNITFRGATGDDGD
jgi:hypothetical protein